MLDVMNTLFLEAEDADWSQRPTSQFGVYVSTTSMTYKWIKGKWFYWIYNELKVGMALMRIR